MIKKGVICPLCKGDGKETCDNPDHGLLMGIGTLNLNGHANGCPCCGNDPEHKIKNGGNCDLCNGIGLTSHKVAEEYLIEKDIDIEYLEELQLD